MGVEAVCRTCLGTVRLQPLFSRARAPHAVREALRLCTGLQIEKGDSLSQMICRDCTETIKSAMRFRRRSHIAEKKLVELQNSSRVYKRINFNNNEDLRLLTDVKVDKSDRYFIDGKTFEIEVKTERELDRVDFDDEENNALLIHFPNDIFEVTSISKVDDLLDSLLSELSQRKHDKECSESEIETKLPESSIQFDDVTNLEDTSEPPSLDDCDRPRLDDCDRKRLDDFDRPRLGESKSNQNEAVPVVKESKPKLTRLDLIDGTPNKNGPNKCRLCKNVSPNIKAFYKHLNSKHFGNKKAILCEFCAMRFTDNQKLLRHCRAKHGVARDDSFPCSHCSYRALDKEQLDVHERRVHTKERPFVCDNCGAGFYSKRVLIQHSRNHTDDKPFQCDKCPSKFKTRQRLCGHTLKIHLRRFTYACPLCDKRLSKSPYMRRHLLREHGVPADEQGRLHKVYLQQ